MQLEEQENKAKIERQLLERLLEERPGVELVGQVLGAGGRVARKKFELFAGPQATIKTATGVAGNAMRGGKEKGSFRSDRKIGKLGGDDDEGLLHCVVDLGGRYTDPAQIPREGAPILIEEGTEASFPVGFGGSERTTVHLPESRGGKRHVLEFSLQGWGVKDKLPATL